MAEQTEARVSADNGAAFVLEVVTALSLVPDYRGALSTLARAAVPGVADWCTVHVREAGGTVRQVAAAHAVPTRTRLLRAMGAPSLLPSDGAGALPQALAHGRPTLAPQLDEYEGVRAFGRDPASDGALAEVLREVGLASLIVVPIDVAPDRRGALIWARGPGSPALGASELALAQRLAACTTPALVGAWRLEAERQARADAEAARQFITAGLDDLPDGFLVLDLHGALTYANSAAARLAGATHEPVPGRPLGELLPASLAGPLLAAAARATREDATVEYETPHPSPRRLAVRVVPTRRGTSVYLRDVTARHAADAERERLLADAERARGDAEAARRGAEAANQTKTEFLATMSHELRTPLNAILGYTGLIADGIAGPVAPGQVAPLSRVRASAQHLLALIEEILVFARLEAGTDAPRLAPADAAAVAREAADLIEPVLETQGLRFVVELPDAPAGMHTDVRKVRQILLNLLANAARFTPAGGEVRLVAARDAGGAVFTVRDSGVGIAAEHHDRIFEPFWQVEQTLTRRTGGTGLGLSVSRRLARLLGGDVTVASVPGAGSVFTVRLPSDGAGSAAAAGV